MQISTSIMYNNLMIANRINAYRSYVEKSTERLSTGKAINSAADSPSDILIISRMSSQIRGIQATQKNIQDAMSLSQVMESSLAQMYEIGLRLKELSIQYNNSFLTAEDKSIIENESTELINEMKVITENSNFGGVNVFEKDKEFGSWSDKITFTLESQEESPTTAEVPGEREENDFNDIKTMTIGTMLKGDFVDKNILSSLASSRTSVYVKQNILESSLSRQQETEVILTDALSMIEDVDMAKEIITKVKYDLLLKTNIQLLSQNLDDQRYYILGLLSMINF